MPAPTVTKRLSTRLNRRVLMVVFAESVVSTPVATVACPASVVAVELV